MIAERGAEAFRGFTWFSNTSATSVNTADDIPEMFSARRADEFLWVPPGWPAHRDDYYAEAHGGHDSLKPALKRLGYHTEGHTYYTTQYAHFREGFDEWEPHTAYVEGEQRLFDDGRLFFQLWEISVLPRVLVPYVVSNTTVERLTSRQTLSRYPPLISYAAVHQFMDEEHAKPTFGRYVFFHVLLPHKPFIFTESCALHGQDYGDNPDDGAIRGQYACAESLMADVIADLKRLGRFDDAMIIFQGDHGGFALKDAAGKYFWKIDRNAPEMRTKALLLIKFPGASDDAPMREVRVPANPSDVGKTILAQVSGVDAGRMKGVDLHDPASVDPDRIRYFYWEEESDTIRYQIDPDGHVGTRDVIPFTAAP